jgi:hypothetical protein
MQKLLGATLLLLFFVVAQTNAFAASFKCGFKNEVIQGVDTIEMNDNTLVINSTVNIPVEESRIRCANFGKQKRFDGKEPNVQEGLQVVLKTCTSEAAMEGHLIDPKSQKAAEVYCDKI